MTVSVVIAVYNGAWCIERALDSVLAQSRPAEEIILCDDGSTDGTADLVARRYGARVRVLRLPHRNASAARGVGLEQARGDWLAFLDADDVWEPGKLERQLAFLARHPEVRWIGSDGIYVSSSGVLRASWLSDYFEPVTEMRGELLAPLLERCFPLHSSMMVERRAFGEAGGLDPTLRYSYDYDLWLRLAADHPGAILAERLVRYLASEGQLSRRLEARHLEDLRIMRRVAQGRVAPGAATRATGAERAAALEFDLGVRCLRTGRIREGRLRLWRAAPYGPWPRRALATAGALAPRWSLAWLMRSPWLKHTVQRHRRHAPRFVLQNAGGGVA
ncbi:MAG: hypothetical protein A2V63_05450 [Candidatus Eisenbacteria bacterium RBG_19FT_COMBO_70_11]|nr:MAG: hypothetical protein A2V63_05450 [Candidatus Eisenbacteria bacterium RBG_19FT_COMBO_70_11]